MTTEKTLFCLAAALIRSFHHQKQMVVSTVHLENTHTASDRCLSRWRSDPALVARAIRPERCPLPKADIPRQMHAVSCRLTLTFDCGQEGLGCIRELAQTLESLSPVSD
jgi:hypothetical protein